MMENFLSKYELDNTKRMGVAAIYVFPKKDDGKVITDALNQDAKDLATLFIKFGFVVVQHIDTPDEKPLADVLKNASDTEIKKGDQIFIGVFLGHGSAGSIKTRHGSLEIYGDIISIFADNEHLNGKPKIFVFQACRGSKTIKTGSEDALALPDGEKNPECSDVITCYSSFYGYKAFVGGEGKRGSPYIQEFVKALRKYTDGNTNFVDIMTFLNMKVSVQTFDKTNKRCQMPSFESSLRKKLFLQIKKKEGAPTGDMNQEK